MHCLAAKEDQAKQQYIVCPQLNVLFIVGPWHRGSEYIVFHTKFLLDKYSPRKKKTAYQTKGKGIRIQK